MAQHFTFLSKPSIHAGLRGAKWENGQKSDKDGLTAINRTLNYHRNSAKLPLRATLVHK
jgi:hypothetical protein